MCVLYSIYALLCLRLYRTFTYIILPCIDLLKWPDTLSRKSPPFPLSFHQWSLPLFGWYTLFLLKSSFVLPHYTETLIDIYIRAFIQVFYLLYVYLFFFLFFSRKQKEAKSVEEGNERRERCRDVIRLSLFFFFEKEGQSRKFVVLGLSFFPQQSKTLYLGRKGLHINK